MRIRRTAACTAAAAMVLGAAGQARAEDTWRTAPPNWTWPDRNLNAVDAAGPKDVWAVGTQGRKYVGIPGDLGHAPITLVDIPSKPVLQHWNGATWTSFSPPGIPGEGKLTDVEVVAANDVWVMGFGGGSSPANYLAHWDGASWRQVTPPVVSCCWDMRSDAGGLWLRSYDALYRVVNGQWTRHPFEMVRGYTVLPSGHVYVQQDEAISRWDGTAWSTIPNPPGDNALAVTSTGELWTAQLNAPAGTAPAVRRWTGSAWAAVPVPASWTGTWDHSIADMGGVVVTVRERPAPYRFTQYRWTGSDWALFTAPAESRNSAEAVSGDGALWGYGVQRHVGTAWTPVTLPIKGDLHVTALPGSPSVFVWGSDPQTGNLVAATNAFN